ncbi:Ger(x)C family spore germination protein [Salipaludibacillus sp. HK11]|uniref:Ger(x)C family spore germination protein n=1 Tax=Salipaludibacillus sp. HK11 TaxID=3394320 RepID=UPI0039FD90DB
MDKRLCFFIFLAVLLILSGCWNARELKDMAIVSAIGIDKSEEGEISVSFQVINPDQVAGGLTVSGDASPIILYTSTGDTVFEAHRKVSLKLPREAFFPHMNLLVINEKLAREDGLDQVIDFFERDHEPRTNATVVVSRGESAENILMVQAPLEKVPSQLIVGQIENIERVLGETLAVDIDDVISDLVSKGKDLVVSGIVIKGDEASGTEIDGIKRAKLKGSLEIDGSAVFKDQKLIGWIAEEEEKGVAWVVGKIKSTVNNVACNEKENAIAIETIRANAKVKSKIENGEPQIHITVQQEGNIAEVNCSKDMTTLKTMVEVEDLLEENIKKEIEGAINIAKEKEVDIFGFGNAIQRQHPQLWKEYEEKWSEMFTNLEVDVQVDANIRRNGMRMNSFQEDNE